MINLPEVDLLRARSSVTVVWHKPGIAVAEVHAEESSTNVCFAFMWYFKMEVLHWNKLLLLQCAK